MDIKLFNLCMVAGWLLVLIGGIVVHPGWGLAVAGGLLLALTLASAYLGGVHQSPGKSKPAAGDAAAGGNG